jgi:hypothetical protein
MNANMKKVLITGLVALAAVAIANRVPQVNRIINNR